MKTSDKLLLTLALMILGVFGAVHLTLYARLKTGHIINMDSREGWVRRYNGSAPSRIIIKGNINITLSATDSTVVDIQQDAAAKVRCRVAGDSVVVESDSLLSINPHDYFQNYNELPWASVEVSPGTSVRLEGQLVLVRGNDRSGKASMGIEAINSQLWVGETYGQNTDYPVQYYDSLHIKEINSNLIVHQNAEVNRLSVNLDDQSELNDRKGSFGSFHLEYTPKSKINVKGSTFDMLKKRY